ncbi:MAG: DUF6544 family protein [Synechococcus sp.]
MLPSQGVRWDADEDSSAKATLTDGENSLSMLFVFNESGTIESIRAEARGRIVAGDVVPTPWECRLSHY